ncbi:MAG: DUF3800 domain-containing protein [Mycobacterium sp.]|nr:DUF3800 domain-containing protein [Mycobacterium sp.]
MVWASMSGLPLGKRERRLSMALQAFVDDSGCEPQSHIFVLAGFVASPQQWAAFSADWQAALDEQPALGYFKMNEAAGLSGEFDPAKGWDEAKRDDRVITFARIIAKHTPDRFFTAVRHDLFAKYLHGLPTRNRQSMRDPYFLLFYELITSVAVYQASIPRPPEPCDFIFDEHGKIGRRAFRWWDSFRASAKSASGTDFTPYLGSPPIFRNDKDLLPLQAADFYAWHLRRRLGWAIEISLRPAETVIEPLNLLGVVFNEARLADIRDTMVRIGKRFVADNPDVRMVRTGPRRRNKS